MALLAGLGTGLTLLLLLVFSASRQPGGLGHAAPIGSFLAAGAVLVTAGAIGYWAGWGRAFIWPLWLGTAILLVESLATFAGSGFIFFPFALLALTAAGLATQGLGISSRQGWAMAGISSAIASGAFAGLILAIS
ncbi:MAG TPA: hypothetical protein VJ256_07300 [Dehalococcoidia bacterium]|nr:hypothetical protein [Dehalococcoidia bacterium]